MDRALGQSELRHVIASPRMRAHMRNEAYPALRAEGHEMCLDLLALRVVLPLELGAPEELVVLGIAVLSLPHNPCR